MFGHGAVGLMCLPATPLDALGGEYEPLAVVAKSQMIGGLGLPERRPGWL